MSARPAAGFAMKSRIFCHSRLFSASPADANQSRRQWSAMTHPAQERYLPAPLDLLILYVPVLQPSRLWGWRCPLSSMRRRSSAAGSSRGTSAGVRGAHRSPPAPRAWPGTCAQGGGPPGTGPEPRGRTPRSRPSRTGASAARAAATTRRGNVMQPSPLPCLQMLSSARDR